MLFQKRMACCETGSSPHSSIDTAMPRAVNGGVDRESRRIRAVLLIADDLALVVDDQQVGCRDLGKAQPETVDQESVFLLGMARRDMGVDQVVPAAAGDKAVGRGQVDARPPFGGADAGRGSMQRGVHERNVQGVRGPPFYHPGPGCLFSAGSVR
jgi:hypothetical protein